MKIIYRQTRLKHSTSEVTIYLFDHDFTNVEFILGKYGELNTSAIFDKICLNEPELKPQRAKVIGSISAILSAKSKNEANMPFKKNENVRGEYVYSLNNKPPLNEGDLFEDIPGR